MVLCPVFIMARRFLSARTLSSLLSDIRISHARQYTAAAAEAMRSSGAAGREFPEVSKAGRGGGNNKGTVFWMRDPATGNWIPEDHFGETDTAELRQKLLSSRK
uniref:Late embryogenesis abundant protein LEA3-5 n=1 Tax=Pinus tabuliformis TaxID=88731 RepID=A0A0A7RG87_PINTB|nr:late embryogenesis abundant protein LEA3-5 [Pinus tabuliformis]